MFIVTRLPQSPVAQGSVSLCPGTDHLNYKNISNEIQSPCQAIFHLYQLLMYCSSVITGPKINSLPELFNLKMEDYLIA